MSRLQTGEGEGEDRGDETGDTGAGAGAPRGAADRPAPARRPREGGTETRRDNAAGGNEEGCGDACQEAIRAAQPLQLWSL